MVVLAKEVEAAAVAALLFDPELELEELLNVEPPVVVHAENVTGPLLTVIGFDEVVAGLEELVAG